VLALLGEVTVAPPGATHVNVTPLDDDESVTLFEIQFTVPLAETFGTA